ncbi:MAG: sodium-dependent transporter [Sphingomonadales bacterium]
MLQSESLNRTFTSRAGFLFSAIGVAVGLGNLWRFPYIAGENGGGAFVLIYILCVFLIGVPIISGELILGKKGRGSAVLTMKRLIAEKSASPLWKIIGWLSVAIPFFGLTYYSVVAGWSMDYVIQAAGNSFLGFDAARSNAAFDELAGDPGRSVFWQAIFIFITAVIVGKGVQGGIEKSIKIMMPILFILLITLVGYAFVEADFARGFYFLFNPDFSKVTGEIVLMAMGQAFFSIAVGVGAMITYSAYLKDDTSLGKYATVIAGADTLVAILAALAIFPIVFASGLVTSEGPSLIFATLPIAFGSMPGGYLFGFLFFILIFFAALTSSICMLEPFVSYGEEKKGMSRPVVSGVIALGAFIVGIGATLSFNIWVDFYPLSFIPIFETRNIFGILDYSIANLLIPVNGLLIALFSGWILSKDDIRNYLGIENNSVFALWHFLLKIAAPIAVMAVLYSGVSG